MAGKRTTVNPRTRGQGLFYKTDRFDDFSYLGADLVAALAGLHVDDLAHGCVGVVVGLAHERRGELRPTTDGAVRTSDVQGEEWKNRDGSQGFVCCRRDSIASFHARNCTFIP